MFLKNLFIKITTNKEKLIYLFCYVLNAASTLGISFILIDSIILDQYLASLFILQLIVLGDFGIVHGVLRNYTNVIISKSIPSNSDSKIRHSVTLFQINLYTIIYTLVLLVVNALALILTYWYFELAKVIDYYELIHIWAAGATYIIVQILISILIPFFSRFKAKLYEMIFLVVKLLFIIILVVQSNVGLVGIYSLHVFVNTAVIMIFLTMVGYKLNVLSRTYNVIPDFYGLAGWKNNVGLMFRSAWINGFTSLLGYFINYSVSLVILGMPQNSEKVVFLLFTRINNFARYFAQINIISYIPVFISQRSSGKLDLMYREFSSKHKYSLLVYTVLSFVLIILVALHFGDIYLSMLAIVLYTFFEINQSNHAQLIITRNRSPFLFVSIITVVLLNVFLQIVDTESMLVLVAGQITCSAVLNFWFSIYLVKREVKDYESL
jgi:hypothetical protein